MDEESLVVRAKNHLQRVKQLDARVRILTRKYNAMVASRTFYKPILLTGMPGGGNADSMAASDDMLDMRAEVDRLIDERDSFTTKARRQINALPEPYATILRLRYIDMKNLTQIAHVINRSYNETSRLHCVGLEIFAVKWVL